MDLTTAKTRPPPACERCSHPLPGDDPLRRRVSLEERERRCWSAGRPLLKAPRARSTALLPRTADSDSCATTLMRCCWYLYPCRRRT